MLYFAYGSNMNHEQMKVRCPGASFLRRAYLDDFKFVYDGYSHMRNGAVANIIQAKGSRVWGGLFEINKANLSALDQYEGHPNSYNRAERDVNDDNDIRYKAIVYCRAGKDLGKPLEEYRKIIIQGARDCDVSEEYIQSSLGPT